MGTTCICSHDSTFHQKIGAYGGPQIGPPQGITERYICKVKWCECQKFHEFKDWHPFSEGDNVIIRRGKYVGHQATVLGWTLKHWYTPVEPTIQHLACVVKLDNVNIIKQYDYNSLRLNNPIDPADAVASLQAIIKGLKD